MNSAGEYLQGWAVNPSTGVVNQCQLQPIQVSQAQFDPVATSQVNLAANLPAASAAGTTGSSTVDIYDTQGASHQLSLNWAATSTPNQWTLTLSDSGGTIGSATANFNSNGTLASVVPASNGANGSVTADGSDPNGTSGLIDFTASDVSTGGNPIQLNLGTLNGSEGVTQFAASQYHSATSRRTACRQAASPASRWTTTATSLLTTTTANRRLSPTFPSSHSVMLTRCRAKTARHFTATAASGNAVANSVNTNGAGTLVAGSVESSNVDIATEFSKLIVAQQAYGANAKMITSANQMLQTTIDMKQ